MQGRQASDEIQESNIARKDKGKRGKKKRKEKRELKKRECRFQMKVRRRKVVDAHGQSNLFGEFKQLVSICPTRRFVCEEILQSCFES